MKYIICLDRYFIKDYEVLFKNGNSLVYLWTECSHEKTYFDLKLLKKVMIYLRNAFSKLYSGKELDKHFSNVRILVKE